MIWIFLFHLDMDNGYTDYYSEYYELVCGVEC